MEELTDEEIEDAAAASGAHFHPGVWAEDGTLLDHLAGDHGLEVEPAVSPATQQGLHDRLHGESKAADD